MDQLTYDWLSRILVGKESAFAIADKEREIEEVFHGLPKVVWVDNEFENIHVPIYLGQYLFELSTGDTEAMPMINHSRRPTGD